MRALLALHEPPPSRATPGIAGGASLLGHRIDALTAGRAAPRLAVPAWAALRSAAGLGMLALLLLLAVTTPSAGPEAVMPMPMGLDEAASMALAWLLRAGALLAVLGGARRALASGSRELG